MARLGKDLLNRKRFIRIAVLAGLAVSSVAAIMLHRVQNDYAQEKLALADGGLAISYTPAPANFDLQSFGGRRVLILGDSRVAHWSPLPNIADRHVFARGVGGETAIGAQRRLEAELAAYRPQDVIIATGINDLVAAMLNPDDKKRLVGDLVARQMDMAREIREAGANPAVMTILPPAVPDILRRLFFWSDSIYDLVVSVNLELRKTARKNGIAVLDAAAMIGREGDPLPERFAVDSLHWNSALYRRINVMIEEELGAR